MVILYSHRSKKEKGLNIVTFMISLYCQGELDDCEGWVMVVGFVSGHSDSFHVSKDAVRTEWTRGGGKLYQQEAERQL